MTGFALLTIPLFYKQLFYGDIQQELDLLKQEIRQLRNEINTHFLQTSDNLQQLEDVKNISINETADFEWIRNEIQKYNQQIILPENQGSEEKETDLKPLYNLAINRMRIELILRMIVQKKTDPETLKRNYTIDHVINIFLINFPKYKKFIDAFIHIDQIYNASITNQQFNTKTLDEATELSKKIIYILNILYIETDKNKH